MRFIVFSRKVKKKIIEKKHHALLMHTAHVRVTRACHDGTRANFDENIPQHLSLHRNGKSCGYETSRAVPKRYTWYRITWYIATKYIYFLHFCNDFSSDRGPFLAVAAVGHVGVAHVR